MTPPVWSPPGVPQDRVDLFRYLHELGWLADYCDAVLPRLVDRLCELIDREVC